MSFRNIFQALLGLFLCAAGSAHAGTFSVSPVRATLSLAHGVNSLTVRNDGEDAAIIQVEIVAWGQHEGQDMFTPSKEILVTPPIFTVPAKGSQVIRIGLRRAPDPNHELDYRMFLREVPPPPIPGFQGLQVALRVSIPIFVLPKSEPKPVLVWQAITQEPGRIKLRVTNTGNAHSQIANYKLSRQGGEVVSSQQVAAYVLPGESREWLLESKLAQGARLELSARTDGDDVQAEMTLTTL